MVLEFMMYVHSWLFGNSHSPMIVGFLASKFCVLLLLTVLVIISPFSQSSICLSFLCLPVRQVQEASANPELTWSFTRSQLHK